MDTGGQRNAQNISAGQIRNIIGQAKSGWMEGVFYFVLMVTAVEAGLVLWDLLTMMPWFTHLVRLAKPNTAAASADMSNAYLVLLGVYAGSKEFLRWTDSQLNNATPEMESEAVAQARWFYRGELIVFFWLTLMVVAIAVRDLGLIPRLPNEVMRVALQSFAIWAGTKCSGQLKSTKAKNSKAGAAQPQAKSSEPALIPTAHVEADGGQPEEQVRINDEHKRRVFAYLTTNEWINNEAGQRVTGLKPHQVTRLLHSLMESGILEDDGTGKGKRYRLKRRNTV